MFLTELKFAIDVLVKWFNYIFKSRFTELDEIKKELPAKKNLIDWSQQTFVTSGFKLATSTRHGPDSDKLTTWYRTFTTQKRTFIFT